MIEEARTRLGLSGQEEVDSSAEVADLVATDLNAGSAERVLTADAGLWELMAASYRTDLWAAAYLINGGCSDDGFDYFRGWLITQGAEVFHRALADPDSLADHQVVAAAASEGEELECEEILYATGHAYLELTGVELSAHKLEGQPTVPNSAGEPDPASKPVWDFDFDDEAEMRRRLPRLVGLFLSAEAG
jgi:hypothetical protein